MGCCYSVDTYPTHPTLWTVIIRKDSDRTDYTHITVFSKEEAKEYKRKVNKKGNRVKIYILPPYLK